LEPKPRPTEKPRFWVPKKYPDDFPDLKPEADSLFLKICRHANKAGVAFFSLRKWAADKSINYRKARRGVDELEGREIIRIAGREHRNGRFIFQILIKADESEAIVQKPVEEKPADPKTQRAKKEKTKPEKSTPSALDLLIAARRGVSSMETGATDTATPTKESGVSDPATRRDQGGNAARPRRVRRATTLEEQKELETKELRNKKNPSSENHKKLGDLIGIWRSSFAKKTGKKMRDPTKLEIGVLLNMIKADVTPNELIQLSAVAWDEKNRDLAYILKHLEQLRTKIAENPRLAGSTAPEVKSEYIGRCSCGETSPETNLAKIAILCDTCGERRMISVYQTRVS